MRRGEGTIRFQAAAILPHLSSGPHHLLFRNGHHPDRSVYLANALVPSSDEVAITGQRRDGDQTELTIDYVLHAAPARPLAAWLLGSLAAVIVLSGLLMRRVRSFPAPRSPAFKFRAVRWTEANRLQGELLTRRTEYPGRPKRGPTSQLNLRSRAIARDAVP